MTESLCCIIDRLAVQRGRSTVSCCVGRRREWGIDYYGKAVGGIAVTQSEGSVSCSCVHAAVLISTR